MVSHKQRRYVVCRPKNPNEICLLCKVVIELKQIVTINTTTYLTITNGKREFTKVIDHSYRWHYMELPLSTDEITTAYDKFLEKETCYNWQESKSKKDKRKFGNRYSYFYTDWFPIKFSGVNFVSYRISKRHYVQKHYTLQDLIDNLPADEMIEYLKDNGFNVCPIVR